MKQCMEKGGFGRSLKVSAVRGKKDKAGENCCRLESNYTSCLQLIVCCSTRKINQNIEYCSRKVV